MRKLEDLIRAGDEGWRGSVSYSIRHKHQSLRMSPGLGGTVMCSDANARQGRCLIGRSAHCCPHREHVDTKNSSQDSNTY